MFGFSKLKCLGIRDYAKPVSEDARHIIHALNHGEVVDRELLFPDSDVDVKFNGADMRVYWEPTSVYIDYEEIVVILSDHDLERIGKVAKSIARHQPKIGLNNNLTKIVPA